MATTCSTNLLNKIGWHLDKHHAGCNYSDFIVMYQIGINGCWERNSDNGETTCWKLAMLTLFIIISLSYKWSVNCHLRLPKWVTIWRIKTVTKSGYLLNWPLMLEKERQWWRKSHFQNTYILVWLCIEKPWFSKVSNCESTKSTCTFYSLI